MPTTLFEQNFNALDASGTFTNDAFPVGSVLAPLTNAGALNNGGPGLDFETLWTDTRGNEGPKDGSESGDFIGVNTFSDGGAPNVGPTGTAVSADVEQNFEFNDGDGLLTLRFEPVDVSMALTPMLSLAYWINDTGYEPSDLFRVSLSDGASTFTALAFSEPDLEGDASADDGSANWRRLDVDLSTTGLDLSAVTLSVEVDTNSSSENIFIDDVVFTDAGDMSPLVISEIMFNPASAEDDWEWVEVHNAGSDAVDLAGYVLDDINSVDLTAANIASGVIAPGGSAVLYNADDISAADFEAAWGTGINRIGVAGWSALQLNNGGDTVSLWSDFASYEGDNEIHANALVTATYPNIDDGAGSVYLTDLGDQGSFALSTEGVSTPVGGDAYVSAAQGGNSGEDVGSPGGLLPDDPIDAPVEITKIHEIQGAGFATPLDGAEVTVQAVVTLVSDQLNGFFLQEEDADIDGDALTSEGVFVFAGGDPTVSVGDRLTLTGTVGEFFDTTQLSGADWMVEDTSVALPSEVLITLPLPDATDPAAFYESVEGMRVRVEAVDGERLTVTDTFTRFGEVGVTSGEPLIQPTQAFESFTPEAEALAAANARDYLLFENAVDDSLSSAPRVGDGIVGDAIDGVMHFTFGDYKVETPGAVGFDPSANPNPRQAAPDAIPGDITVASFNVLNYFTTLNMFGNVTDTGLPPRGAESPGELEDQTSKLVAALSAIDADIVGLIEIENDADDEATETLVDALNAEFGAGVYDFIATGLVGDDAIRQAIIFKPASVTPVGDFAVLDSGDFTDPLGSGRPLNRPALAQTFEDAEGERFTVSVNHLKSKGSPSDVPGDDSDVEGSAALTRVAAAEELAAWLATDPTGSDDPDHLTVGDFNAYAMERAIRALEDAGFTDVSAPDSITYQFDGRAGTLDYVFANEAMAGQVVGATTWNVNSLEAFAQQYSDNQFDALGDPTTPYGSSDHDPIIVGLDLGAPEPETFTLELLHVADQEAGARAVTDAPNLSAVMNALEAQDLGDDGVADNTLRLSSGDAFIPGLFYDASEAVFGAAGVADIQIQNELGFAAIAFGNHEFDFGARELSELITGLDVTDDSDPEDGFVDEVPRRIGDFSALPTGSALDFVGATEDGEFGGTVFPYLSANLDFSSDGFLAPLEIEGAGTADNGAGKVTSSTVVDVNGEAIGVVGATTPRLASISSPGAIGIDPTPFDPNPTEAQIDALAAEIQAEVDALLMAHPAMNKVVLLAHMQQLDIELALAARLENVDVIVGGGSNSRLFDENDRPRDGDSASNVGDPAGEYPQFVTNGAGQTVAVVNTDGSYKYVGRLVLDFDADGNILPESYDPEVSGAYATDDQGVANLDAEGLIDPEIQAIADAIQEQILATESNVFGVAEVFLNGNRSGTDTGVDPDGVRTQETNLGNLTADANLAAAQEIDPTVVISLKNGGGIRASIGQTIVPPGGTEAVRLPNEAVTDGDDEVVKPEGGISQNDIQTTLAFNNGLTLLTLTKAEIVALLEHGVGALPGVSGRFPQVSGVEFSFDSTRSDGDRIRSAEIVDAAGDPIAELVRNGEIVGDAGQEFRVVTLGFLAAPRFDDDGNFVGGGDGYPFPNLDDPAIAARVNPVSLEQEGVQTGDATFADDGTEQDALAEYLLDNFAPDSGVAFDEADAGPALDPRIQNLLFREDTVFEFDSLLVAESDGRRVQRFDLADGDAFLRLDPALDDGLRQRFIVDGLDAGDRVDFSAEDISFTREAGPNLFVYLNGADRDSITFLGADEDDLMAALAADPLDVA